MPTKKDVHIPFEKLKRVSFDCTVCHATMIIDIGSPKQKEFLPTKAEKGRACSACGYYLPDAIFIGFREFIDWIGIATEVKDQNVCLVIDEDILNDRS